MSRLPRLALPGIPVHITHRGVNREATFFADDDRSAYLDALDFAVDRYDVQLHAYVLMTNHVHLLATGSETLSVSRMMQSIGRRYVRYVNEIYRRTGTLWEGRFKACLVDSQDYMLRCYRYIELNPVRAGMVSDPADYRWTSYHGNALNQHDRRLTPHACWLALGADDAARCAAYSALVAAGMCNEELDAIRTYTRQEKALGSARFQAQIETALSRCARTRGAGRPRKSENVL
jgi:putative transposase